MKIFCLAALVILISTFAHADVRYVGNAGTGVLLDGVPYLLDLYEVDNIDPVIDESVTPFSAYVYSLADLDILTPHEIKLLAIKLTEIREMAPSYADSLVVATNQYVWRLINTPLTLLPGGTPVEVDKLVQLANRYGPYVRITKSHWDKLPSSNKIALVLHEMISATLPPTALPGQPQIFEQDAATVRNRVAYIFLPQFKARGSQAFLNLTGVRWELSTLLSKHSYVKAQAILSWKIGASDSPVRIHAGTVSNNGNNFGFCRDITKHVEKKNGSLKVDFYYEASETSLMFFNYNSAFGTQSALEESLPVSHEFLLNSVIFTKENVSLCLPMIDDLTQKTFSIFNKNKVETIEVPLRPLRPNEGK